MLKQDVQNCHSVSSTTTSATSLLQDIYAINTIAGPAVGDQSLWYESTMSTNFNGASFSTGSEPPPVTYVLARAGSYVIDFDGGTALDQRSIAQYINTAIGK